MPTYNQTSSGGITVAGVARASSRYRGIASGGVRIAGASFLYPDAAKATVHLSPNTFDSLRAIFSVSFRRSSGNPLDAI